MKPKEILFLLGLKPAPRTFGYTINTFHLPSHGTVEYAQWLHPNEKKKVLTQASVVELKRFLAPGDVAMDIGAHTGDTSLPMALAVGKSGCVLALEPNPYVFTILKKNSELNQDKTNIIPLQFAATPVDGEFEFEYSDAGFCNGGFHEGVSRWKHGHAFRLKVQGKNLQGFLQREYPGLIPRIRFIKVDAEGYDFTILQSISGLIAKNKPYIMAEVFRRTDRELRLKLYHFLTGLGYAVFRVESEANYHGQRVEEGNLTKWPHYDIFCMPR